MSSIDELRATMARLRSPDGCPWDQEQTHQSLCSNLIEEVAELIDTIDRDDFPHMREELGDVLLQVVFHAQMAEEAGHFNFDDVAREINDKLVRRHPHVFGEMNLETSEAVLKEWEAIKSKEKKNGPEQLGVLKPIPKALPALLKGDELAKQMDRLKLVSSKVDLDGISRKAKDLTEAIAGKELMEWVWACRRAGIDPESSLRRMVEAIVDEIETT